MAITKKINTKKTTKPVYVYAIGRRREAVARVKLFPKQTGSITINNRKIEDYFSGAIYKKIYLEPLRTCNCIDKYFIEVKVIGSGKFGQLGAVVHGISRALVKLDAAKNKPILKAGGFLKRDSRTRQRRKTGMGGKSRRKRQSPRR